MQYEAVEYSTPFDELVEKESTPDVRGELCVEAVIRLCDWAARHPECWTTAKAWLTNPGTSQKQISRLIGLNQATVSRHIRAVRKVINNNQDDPEQVGSEDFYSR